MAFFVANAMPKRPTVVAFNIAYVNHQQSNPITGVTEDSEVAALAVTHSYVATGPSRRRRTDAQIVSVIFSRYSPGRHSPPITRQAMNRLPPQTWRCRVAALLDDPVGQAVLRRDGLSPADVFAALEPVVLRLRTAAVPQQDAG